jgi:hypothetical protein
MQTMIKTSLLMLIALMLNSFSSITYAKFDSAVFNKDKPLRIQRVTPSGVDVPAGRQVVFTFNQPVVPLGKMERDASEIPITITPRLHCQWRWLNTSNLACQLGDETALKSATRYKVLVNPGIMTETKQTLQEPFHAKFITRRPAISYTSFQTWSAPGMPQIRVHFNQAVTHKSVEKHLFLQYPAKKQRVTVTVKSQKQDKPKVSSTWIVSPKSSLPLDTPVTLKVEPGLQSSLGPELGVESRVVTTFQTFPKFEFLGVECTTLYKKEVLIRPNTRRNARRCDPLQTVYLRFSSPVLKEVLQENLLITPDLAGGRTDYNPWENISSSSRLEGSHRKGQIYLVWLPTILKAYQTYVLQANTTAFEDEFGRSLLAPIDLQFATNHRAPKHVLDHEISVLEQGVASEVPIVVTNLKRIYFYYHLLTAKGWTYQKRQQISVPVAKDIAFQMPLGIRKLIRASSGAVQGYFTTKPDVNNKYARKANWFFSQVTPFHVQAKLGHHNTLVWVTDFAKGKPVSGVKVSLYRDTYTHKKIVPKPLVSAVTDEFGMAWLPGTKKLDPELDNTYWYGNRKKDKRFFIRCQKKRDIALLPLDVGFRVSVSKLTDYSFGSSLSQKYGHIHTWGTTAQGVYKVGDTVQYKFLVRDQSNKTFIPAPRESYTLQVIDPMGKTAHEVKNFSLSEFGAYHGEFVVSKTAAVGWYQFKLTANFKKNNSWWPMRVLVSDFTPSPFHVETDLNGKLFRIGNKVTVNTSAKLHAGGPYVNAQTKINAILSPQSLNSPHAKGFEFDVAADVDAETVYSVKGKKVNDKGQLQTSFTLPTTSKVLYGNLTVESAVRDDRGKDVANRTTARYVGRDRFVGLKETSWVITAGKEAKVLALVVDESGNPINGTAIDMSIERRVTKAAKVKSAGNAYLTHYKHEWIKIGSCKAKSSKADVSTCTFVPPKAGAYKVIATIKDTKGRPHSTDLQQWAIGKDYVLWETTPGHGLKIMPEQASYKVGETARYLVKNPFPGTGALITVERFGTIKSWTQTLEGSASIIEVPIEPDYVPGFFVSVTVMSPRVDKPIGENKVDLGKPAFRMGYARTDVKEPYKEIVVDIKTDKPVYKLREPVTINLHAKPRHPENDQPAKIELAVTVLDESVFDLLAQGRDYFDPYKGFYTLDDLDIVNFSLLMRLVGRQKFEKKGANAGGDGGGDLSMRESLEKYVSYWNPAIKTDSNGMAKIQFTPPDNFTGWRVLVMAVTPGDRMGLGDANFKVNQPVEIRSALPNQVISGDKFQARFTILNRTDKVRDLKVTLEAKGPVVDADDIPTNSWNFKKWFSFSFWKNETPTRDVVRKTQTITAKPYERYHQWLSLETTRAGTIQFTVTAADAQERDGLRKTLEVQPRRTSTTAATYGTTMAKEVTESVQFPTDIQPDVGGLNVVVSPTVISGIDGAFEYMRDYPYTCWEQKLSKGTMASHYNNLFAYLPESINWQNSQMLPRETIDLASKYQAPNGGMAYFIAKNDRVSPYLSAYTALAFNWLRDSDHKIPTEVETKLHDYLKTMLRKNVMPKFYTKGMASTVRAVALAALAKHGKINKHEIRRYGGYIERMDLFGKAQFLAAALQVPKTKRYRSLVVDMILAHADQTAGKIAFIEDTDSGYKRMLSSSLRSQCALLSSLSAYDASKGQNSEVGDIPFKLVRAITQTRQNPGHWENTQENMFCMNALVEYARVYEDDEPAMTIQSWFNGQKMGDKAAQFDDVKSPPVTFTHKMTTSDPGRKAQVKLERAGTGRLYYTLRLKYSEKAEQAKAINAGIEVKREYHVERDGKWKLLTSPMKIKTGELVRVDLYVSLPAPRHFVVVDDPVPGGLEPVNRDLATASQVDANKAEGQYANGSFWFSHDDWQAYNVSWWSFYHKELRHHAARFYSDYLPAGNYHLSYVAQAIAPGEFNVMATHSEEMYEPEVFGKGLPAVLQVERD